LLKPIEQKKVGFLWNYNRLNLWVTNLKLCKTNSSIPDEEARNILANVLNLAAGRQLKDEKGVYNLIRRKLKNSSVEPKEEKKLDGYIAFAVLAIFAYIIWGISLILSGFRWLKKRRLLGEFN